MTSTENICHQVERQSCHIDGETFMFEVQSASIVLDRPDQAILQIAVFRRTASGQRPAATMRVTAPLHELERIPTLLASALEEWLLLYAHAVVPGSLIGVLRHDDHTRGVDHGSSARLRH